MNLLEKLGLLEDRFLRGEVPVGELPLGLEPLLWQVSEGTPDEEAIRKIMNDLELVLFTLPAEQQAAPAAKLLEDARAFVEKGVSGMERGV